MRALWGSFIISRSPSSPTLNRRVAVSTVGPMPSPIKRMTFLASAACAWERPPSVPSRAVQTSVFFMVMFILIIPYSLAAALILPNTAVLSREPWKRSAPWPMAPRKTSVPPWVSLPISPTLTTTSW